MKQLLHQMGVRVPLSLLAGVLVLGCCASASQMRTSTTDKGSDARILAYEKNFTLKADGSRLHRVYSKTRLFTEYAIDHLGDPRLQHNAVSQKLHILRADTTMVDGTVVSIKPNSINQTTPDALAAAPDYTDMRETVVTLVGLERGCTTDLEYELQQQASNDPMSFQIPLRSQFPTDNMVVKVTVPRDVPLHWQCLGCKTQPTETTTASGPELRFVWQKVPAQAEEIGQLNQPRLVVSTAASWPAFSKRLLQRFTQATTGQPELQKQADELTKNLPTQEQRLLAIWRFVVDNIATVRWPLQHFHPAKAGVVLQRSYGHQLDKAVLLSALLQTAGIPSRPVLLSRDSLFAQKVPGLSQFSQVWLIAQLGSRELWLSPTEVNAGAGKVLHQGLFALDLQSGTPSPVKPCSKAVEHNQSILIADLKVCACKGAISGTVQTTLSGVYNPYLTVTPKHSSQQVMQHILSGGLGSDCDKCSSRVEKLAWDSSVFAYKIAGQAHVSEDVMEVELPWPASSQLLELDLLQRSRRHTGLALRSVGTEKSLVTVEVPKGYELRSKLLNSTVDNPIGQVFTSSSLKDNRVTVSRTLVLKKRLLSAKDSPALRALITEWLRADARSLLFIKTPVSTDKPAS